MQQQNDSGITIEESAVTKKNTETAGVQFVKQIGKVGCIMFLLMFVLYMIICFAPASSRLDGYTPPQTDEYYALHLNELKSELDNAVFSKFDTEITSTVHDTKIEISVPEDNFWDVRSELIQHFDQKLFEFTKSN